VTPELGRDFEPADDRLGGANLVVVSHSLWRRRLGADSAIIGRDLTLDDDRFTVVGVMPAGFENVLTPSAEIWALLQYDPSLPTTGREWGHHLRMVGRTRSGVALDQVHRDLAAIAAAPVAEFSRPRWASMAQGFTVSSLEEEVTREVRPALLAVLGAVFLLLGIASVNVTNLFLARAGERRGEFAMRAALGAGRTRLVRQSLIESLVLALLSGAAGLGIAQLGIKALVALSPPGLPRVDAIRIDGAVFGFGLALTTLLGLLVGLVPAHSTARTDLVSGLERGSGRMAAGQGALRAALVVAEVALALVLLVGAGLLFRSLGRLFAVAPGFVPAKLLTMQVQTSGHRLQAPGATGRFFDQALAAVRQVPGVRSADFTSQLPLSGEVDKYGVQFESNTEVDPRLDRGVFRAAVTPGYLPTLGIPLVRGRLLEAGDRATAPPVALISEGFARRKFPATDPIGQRMHVGSTDRPWYTVVGVVGDVKHTSLAIGQGDAVYLTPDQWYFEDSPRWLVVRTDGDPLPLAEPIKRAIWSVDKDQPIVRIATMDQLVTASAAERRFALIVFEAFALVALALAAIGIYGVMSGNVTERTRELGVRSALGASRASILGMVIRQGMSLTAVGAVIGLGGAVLGSRALESLLFGVTRLDPMAYLGVTALLAGVAMVACGVPAWRAARVDPSTTLRTE
jgi:predicted permease